MKIKRPVQILLLTLLLFIFLVTTDPNKISLPLILIPYVLASIIIYRLSVLILGRVYARSANRAKIKLYSLLIAAVSINFALLKSIGQLTVQDGLISLAIIIIAGLYINKFSFSNISGSN